MPIYEYRCTSCGFEREHLQKLSDPLLSTCPNCHAETYIKKVSAAGFQLKGKGWYATDFKGGGSPAPTGEAASAPPCQGGHGACSCC
ncbi:MAG: zinc ribbon domain-containing protein [Betaproteobacteria bacterium]|nr:zinc ribbon domain-containing protein [Betaproteobacteria bacterium]